jgi:transcriptional regulator with XRE-family HTH domain
LNIAESNEPLAQRILFLIKESGLKQFVVAERAGYSAQEFNAMLNGRKLIKACDIPNIATALGVEVNELYRKDG